MAHAAAHPAEIARTATAGDHRMTEQRYHTANIRELLICHSSGTNHQLPEPYHCHAPRAPAELCHADTIAGRRFRGHQFRSRHVRRNQ